MWIKKLCESLVDNQHDGSAKLIRNEYSAKLLGLLENYQDLKYPFNERPPADHLKPYVYNQNFSQLKKKKE